MRPLLPNREIFSASRFVSGALGVAVSAVLSIGQPGLGRGDSPEPGPPGRASNSADSEAFPTDAGMAAARSADGFVLDASPGAIDGSAPAVVDAGVVDAALAEPPSALGLPTPLPSPSPSAGATAPSVALEPPAIAAVPGASDRAVDVMVRAESVARRMEDSAQAVQVIDLEQAQLESADLGAVMARAPGVSLRRMGGLGSETRVSIGGMQGDQVRYFLDGVPLHYMGYSFGIANVPVNLASRIELYSGVVPIRFGADALGAAVNLVSDEKLRRGATLSYQYGSFGTQRATAIVQHVDPDSGLFARLEAFRDDADNDYRVRVLTPDESGQEQQRWVRRYHDGYRAQGVAAEAGVTRRRWANRFSLRGFVTGHDKELQTDRIMAVSFGEAEERDSTSGALLRYRNNFGKGWSLSTLAGYTRLNTRFIDVGSCVYSWLGECTRKRKSPGELTTYASANGADQRTSQHHVFNRNLLSVRANDWLTLNLSVAPTYVQQSGRDVRITDPELRDPLRDGSTIFTLINGLEARFDLLDGRLEAASFAKQYLQAVRGVEGQAGQTIEEVHEGSHHGGAGALVRYKVTDWLLSKISYEWATRLPEIQELLGDNSTVLASPSLRPERSHNVNVGSALRLDETRTGFWSLAATGFARVVDDLILLMPNWSSRFSIHRNVYAARALGVAADARWKSPGEYVSLSGNITYQEYVATANDGPFGYLDGKRLPNRPWLFANATLGLQFSNVFRANDRLFSNQYLSWTDEFYRGWEGVGKDQFKQVIPTQLTLQMSLGYQQQYRWGRLSASVEMQNVTDADVYDFYGAQKPGRAVYAKMIGELR